MTYEKVALVIIFLGVLLAAQIYLYTRSRSNPKMQASIKGLKVISRLNLSKNSQLNIVNAGEESFLIVCSKNSQAAVVPLNSEKFATNLEGYSDETE
jgi:flagellar biogenesis protein FliO